MKRIAVIGLGYVGLGLAVALNRHYDVYGYDNSEKRMSELRTHRDRNQLVGEEELANCSIRFVSNIKETRNADFFIVSVPTPAFFYEMPNLKPLILATKELAAILKKGDIVVYESTVYPGATDEVCLPLLEEISGLRVGEDFGLGYSPERVSPNDPQYSLKNITKVISAQNEATLQEIQSVYQSCCDSVYPVSSIKTAEAVKILENTQRDVNIAFMNEFSKIMHALDLNTQEIIEAAKTKWSFVAFQPGLVGGHCIAVDPLYLSFKAKRLGVEAELIRTARQVNDGMTHFVLQELNALLAQEDLLSKNCRLGIFGITYKQNVPDVRNSLALKFIKELKQGGFCYQVHDPLADKENIWNKYDIELKDFKEMNNFNVAVIMVAHDYYRQLGLKKILEKMSGRKIVMDIPNLFAERDCLARSGSFGASLEGSPAAPEMSRKARNVRYWSL